MESELDCKHQSFCLAPPQAHTSALEDLSESAKKVFFLFSAYS